VPGRQNAKTPGQQPPATPSNPQRPGSPQPAARRPPPAARPASSRQRRGWRLWPASCILRPASCVLPERPRDHGSLGDRAKGRGILLWRVSLRSPEIAARLRPATLCVSWSHSAKLPASEDTVGILRPWPIWPAHGGAVARTDVAALHHDRPPSSAVRYPHHDSASARLWQCPLSERRPVSPEKRGTEGNVQRPTPKQLARAGGWGLE
jgi:hypothetical protein